MTMAALIFDSTPLIHLGRARLLEKLKHLNTRNYLPKAVYQEVVELGKDSGKEDALYVEALMKEGLFEVIEIKPSLKLPAILSPADQEVLSLAREKKGTAVMDEEAGRKVAEILGIKTMGSIGLLFAFFNHKIIPVADAKKIIDGLIDDGWYCSPPLYSLIMGRLEKMQKFTYTSPP